jgi:hypothetical protein
MHCRFFLYFNPFYVLIKAIDDQFLLIQQAAGVDGVIDHCRHRLFCIRIIREINDASKSKDCQND